VLLVNDTEILSAASLLLQTAKLVVEFSGAAAVAAVRSGQVPVEGRHVVAVISGGNLDPSLFSRLTKTT
jgi:threonine dehydratase